MNRKTRKILKWSLLGLPILLLAGIVFILATLPDISSLNERNPVTTSFMKYRQEQLLKKGKRIQPVLTWTPLSRVSKSLIQAVLIAEDDKFFQHEGFDWQAMREAMKKNIEKKRWGRGGSTITQQLAKNLYLTPDRVLIRKVQEAAIAWKMEKQLSKTRILELYLNVIEWGEGIFGITASARHYFGCTPKELILSQSIRLASVLPNPMRFFPRSEQSRRMNRKRRIIAQRMLQRGWISSDEFQQCLTEMGLEK